MTKTMSVLFVLLSLLTCGVTFSDTHVAMDYDSKAIPEFNAEVKMLKFTAPEKAKIQRAIELIKQVIISEEFKEAVLNHQYKAANKFANNKGLTNLEIYEKILRGAERLSPTVDYTMDLTLVAFYRNAETVGYTVASTPKIYMNRKHFRKNTAAEVTTNIVHEWLHKLGFSHDKSETSKRRYSVPYAVGYIVRSIAKNL